MEHLHAPLPSEQHEFEGLPRLTEHELHRRRERLFILFAGLFLGTLAMLNILGITRFVVFASWSQGSGWDLGQWGSISIAVAVGVLPYPLTFLCTDFISELYGRRRANFVVWIGLVLNLWILFIIWLAGNLPVAVDMVSYGTDSLGREVMAPPLPEPVYAEDGTFQSFDESWTFYRISQLTFGAVAASMIAYLVAQLVDVQVFHFWKRLTRGKHLWIRNNGSTLISQLVDTAAVILITHYYARALPIDHDAALWPQLGVLILSGYVFKILAAMIDTVPFILGTRRLVRYLRLPPPGG